MIKFPYGIASFKEIRECDYLYIDRSPYIRMLEDKGQTLVLVRPRRFGKSLLLNMLETYYDINEKDNFDKYFGDLAIGKNPTPLRNKFLILKLDFSNVSPIGTVKEIERDFHDYCNKVYARFIRKYQGILTEELEINSQNSLATLEGIWNCVEAAQQRVYVLIDEYDNFANALMTTRRVEEYHHIVTGDGILKTFFKKLKSATQTVIKKIFITGVAPVVLSDVSSGFNISINISLNKRFHDLCGFSEEETSQILKKVLEEIGKADEFPKFFRLMQIYYNGYRFHVDVKNKIYNPTLVLYFLEVLQEEGRPPRPIWDPNIHTDINTIDFFAKIAPGQEAILRILGSKNNEIKVKDLFIGFQLRDIMDLGEKDYDYISSLLYYFGLLTIARQEFNLILEIPNRISKELYLRKIAEILFPKSLALGLIQKEMFQKGNIKKAVDFLEGLLEILSNRDYLYKINELGYKLIFLSIFYRPDFYLIESESEIMKGYADLLYMVRKDRGMTNLVNFILEFKYISLKEIGETTKELKKLSAQELEQKEIVKSKVQEAKAQLLQYERDLNQKYPEIKFRKYIIVGIGFVRILGFEVM